MSEKFQEIKQTLITALQNKIPAGKIEAAFEQTKQALEQSHCIVYCTECETIFYAGKPDPIIHGKSFVDFKYLAYRHVWDTKHKVIVALDFFQKVPSLFKMTLQQRVPYFQSDGTIDYSASVEERRERLREYRDSRATETNDKNWDANSKAVCSICGRAYHNPIDACMCHMEQKPWLPMKEVESIRFYG